MGSLRIQREQDGSSRRSQAKKPPNQIWQPTVPSWEKNFCSTIGSVPWKKLLETKKYMHLYESVVQWNDSAGEEAFSNAKKRYWAQINGLPCNISLPDPNQYIDDVDWESQIDPDFILNLDRAPEALEEKKKGSERRENALLLFYQDAPPVIGWGDIEEELKKDAKDCPVPNQYNENYWNISYEAPDNGGRNWGTWESNNLETPVL